MSQEGSPHQAPNPAEFDLGLGLLIHEKHISVVCKPPRLGSLVVTVLMVWDTLLFPFSSQPTVVIGFVGAFPDFFSFFEKTNDVPFRS